MRKEVIGDAVLYCGDCLDVASELEAASIDALVSDPPYGLEFMGKDWDRGVPGVHFWQAFSRILKPGAHLLAFGGTRTFHRQVVAIEDAGFEIRDQLGWVYGSGFPKSMDVSKAIDKHGGTPPDWFGPWFRKWREDNGVTQKQVAELFPSKTGGLTGCVANWELGFNLPTPEQFNLIRDTFGLPFESIESAEREVVGNARGTSLAVAPGQGSERNAKTMDITAPATEAARRWAGWGTALKPAWEPICLARKPLVGTVAGNVLRYGTGAINVDACRIPGEKPQVTQGINTSASSFNVAKERRISGDTMEGRWPANILHDGSDEVVALFPAEDGESAARFFYTAKASREDRDEGLEAMRIASAGEITGGRAEGSAGLNNPRAGAGRNGGGRNIHPTVKPTDLMRWCIRLVAPAGSVVCDPFMGSGSTGKAAMLEGRRFVGAELSPEYFDIACRRIEAAYKAAKAQPTLFDEHEATRGKAADILQPSFF